MATGLCSTFKPSASLVGVQLLLSISLGTASCTLQRPNYSFKPSLIMGITDHPMAPLLPQLLAPHLICIAQPSGVLCWREGELWVLPVAILHLTQAVWVVAVFLHYSASPPLPLWQARSTTSLWTSVCAQQLSSRYANAHKQSSAFVTALCGDHALPNLRKPEAMHLLAR